MKLSRAFWILALVLVMGPAALTHKISAQETPPSPPPPLVILLAADPIATESGSEQGRFLAVRSGSTDGPLTVYYRMSGSADNGVDYDELAGRVVIPAGEYFAPIHVNAFEDELVEGNEHAVATLVEAPNAGPLPPYFICWPHRGTVTILDNDKPANEPPLVRLLNPPDGAEIEGPTDIPLVARAWDTDGRVVSVEFFANGESLGIARNWPLIKATAMNLEAGISTDREFTDVTGFPVFTPEILESPDHEVLPHQLFRLKWEHVRPGKYALVAVATDNLGASSESEPIEITVTPPPPQPIVNVVARDPIATEGGHQISPTGPVIQDVARFVIKRRGSTDIPLDVFYRLSGTAANGEDYVELPNIATIPEGSHYVEVIVDPIDDNEVEGRESVILTLVEPACPDIFPPPADCYLVGRQGRARAVILDNDRPPGNLPARVAIVSPEDGSIFRGPADIAIVADARDRDGRVVSVEFFEGENSLGLVMNPPIMMMRPSIEGEDEIQPIQPPFVFKWENVPAGHYVLRALATDNDGDETWSTPVEIKVVEIQPAPVVTIHTIDGSATEQSPLIDSLPDTARFEVRRTGGTGHSLVVSYRITGMAENGVDYRELSGKVEIPASRESAEILIDPLDDEIYEGDESVIIALRHPEFDAAGTLNDIARFYHIGEPAIARAVIHDDDPAPQNLPPRVAIVTPPDESRFLKGAEIRLAAAAGDRDGRVTQVEFFANNDSLGVVPASDTTDALEQLFKMVWENAPVGHFTLTAVATDDDGSTTRSEPVRINVIDPCQRTHVWITAIDPVASEQSIHMLPLILDPTVPVASDGPVRPTPIYALDDATIRISRRACDVSFPLEVHYKISGTAENGVDYRELHRVAVISANQWHVDVQIVAIDDNLVEETETVILTLEPPVCPDIVPPPIDCYLIHEPAKAIVFIRDNDHSDNQLPKIAIVHPSNGDVLPLHEPTEIVAEVVDPDGWVGLVEFYANGNKIGEQQIVFVRAPDPGHEQRFSFSWQPEQAGEYSLVAKATDDRGGMQKSEPVRVKADDEYPIAKVMVFATDPVGAEVTSPLTVVDPSPNSALFTIHRTGKNDVDLDVYYALGGTAKNGEDYLELSGGATIKAGEWSTQVRVNPFDDKLVEGTETVVIELVQIPCVAIWPPDPGCYVVGQPERAVAYIRDNDFDVNLRPKVAIIDPLDGDVFTAPTDLTLRTLTKDPDGWVGLVEFYDGHEKIGEMAINYFAEPAPGQEQEFEFLWENVPAGGHVLTAIATDNDGEKSVSDPVRIRVRESNDPPVVTIHARDPHASEGNGNGNGEPNPARFRVKRTGPTDAPLTVFYDLGGTATNGEDYNELSGRVTIPEGRRSAVISVIPIDDEIHERVETVLAKLTVAPSVLANSIDVRPPYIVGRPGRAAAFIRDNDHPRPDCEELPDGMVSLCLEGRPGTSYRIEFTTDFEHWFKLEENTSYDGTLQIIDPDAREHGKRFYRLIEAVDELRSEDEVE